MNFRNLICSLMAVCAFAAVSQASATPTLLITDGILTGANNVEVNGKLYNVAFVNSICNVMSNCSEPVFELATQSNAQAAAQALLDQVFVDSSDGNFDSVPSNVSNCKNSPYCQTFIPYALTDWNLNQFYALDVINLSGAGIDHINQNMNAMVNRFVLEEGWGSNFAVFTSANEVPNDVPEPGSIALIGISLAGLAFARRRKS